MRLAVVEDLLSITDMQKIDAAALLIISLCAIIVIVDDEELKGFGRPLLALVGFLSFAQALWLLGIWFPSWVGYPWPRMTLDLSICLTAISRAAYVIRQPRRHDPVRDWKKCT